MEAKACSLFLLWFEEIRREFAAIDDTCASRMEACL